MKKILLAFDGSEPATHALETAARLTRAFGAELAVVSVVPGHLANGDESTRRARMLHEARAYLADQGIDVELLEPSGDPAQKILIEDPRTSTPGLGLLLWVRQVYGDQAADAWAKLHRRILTVSKSWDEAYGLFLKGEAPLVLSYTTSPAYHVIAEKKDNYAAAEFAEGHYLQVEIAGRIAGSKQPELAQRFLAFVASPAFQAIIPTTNWMYPVLPPKDGLPAVFDAYKPAKALLYPSAEVAAHSHDWIQEWLTGMSR